MQDHSLSWLVKRFNAVNKSGEPVVHELFESFFNLVHDFGILNQASMVSRLFISAPNGWR
jgi:hypothetical protein